MTGAVAERGLRLDRCFILRHVLPMYTGRGDGEHPVAEGSVWLAG